MRTSLHGLYFQRLTWYRRNGSFHHRLLNQESTPRRAGYAIACEAESWYKAGTSAYFEQRKTMVLAEAIYTHWLYLIWKKDKQIQYSILPNCPWDIGSLPYSGCCRFSPLTGPLPGGVRSLTKEERRVANKLSSKARQQALTPQQRAAERRRRLKREGIVFAKIPTHRWRARQCQMNSSKKARKSPRCSLCRSPNHRINKCNLPTKALFQETKWRGRLYLNRTASARPIRGRKIWKPRCTVCKQEGHNIRTCPLPEAAQHHYPRRCSNCWESGHVSTTCSAPPKKLDQLDMK